MLQSILAFHNQSNLFPQCKQSILNLPKDTYEDYLAFLFENNDQLQSDGHILYLQKAAFDSVLENFQDEELSILQEKQDMYIYYIMYSTLYNMGKIAHAEFMLSVGELFQFYTVTLDQRIFIDRVQVIIKETLIYKVSPFSYLDACKDLFSEKMQNKLISIIKFIIGDSLCYKMKPATIFAICIKWTVDRYNICNSLINQLIWHLIDPSASQIKQKIWKLQQMMDEIMSIKE